MIGRVVRNLSGGLITRLALRFVGVETVIEIVHRALSNDASRRRILDMLCRLPNAPRISDKEEREIYRGLLAAIERALAAYLAG